MTTPKPVPTLTSLELFSGKRQYPNFCRVRDIAVVHELRPSDTPYEWPEGERISLPATYVVGGEARSSADLLRDTDTAALLVLRDGKVVYEEYMLSGGVDVPWISFSVAKSFISTLVGIAHDEGHIRSLDDAVSEYVPVSPGSAYDGVPIRTVLRMSSGARWNEDYSDANSDVHLFSRAASGIDGECLDSFIAGMVRESDPETVCRYNSAETQVLGALVRHATGRSVTAYMQEKLCDPLGMRSPGYWMVDARGVEHAYGGLNLTARDFAKIGELYRNNGRWQGKQLVSPQYVKEATTIDGPLRAPGKPIVGGHALPLGYGYQWWIPGTDRERGDYSAIGVYNQFVYVDPSHKATIVKLSANPRYGLSEKEEDNRDTENMAFLQAIAAQL